MESIAEDLGVEAKVVREMEGRLSAHDTSFDMSSDDDDDSAFQAPVNYLEDKRSDPIVIVEEEDWTQSSNRQLAMAIEQLDERSQDILQQRWLSDEKATLHDLAAKYDVSAERIRQLEKNAMKKIRATFEA